jgi:hypothetical protein
MPEITFHDGHKFLFEIDVIEFWAISNGTVVRCKITLDEMCEFARSVTSETTEAEFLRHRPQIEERSRRIIRDEERLAKPLE